MLSHSVQYDLGAMIMPYLLVAAALAGGPVGTVFTYQAQIKQGGVPTTATSDFAFTLWDDPVATLVAYQVGPTPIFDGGEHPD